MNAIDITALIIVGYFLVKGLFNGLVREVLQFVGLCLAVVGAYFFKPLVLPLLPESLREIDWLVLLGPVILFVLILLIFNVLAKLITRSLRVLALSGINRFLGGLFGAAKALLLLYALFYLVLSLVELSNIDVPATLNDSISLEIYNWVKAMIAAYN